MKKKRKIFLDSIKCTTWSFFFFLSVLFLLLSIMLIDETTCVSHTLSTNWNKAGSSFVLAASPFSSRFSDNLFGNLVKDWVKAEAFNCPDYATKNEEKFKTDLKMFGLEKHRKSIKQHDGAWEMKSGGEGMRNSVHSSWRPEFVFEVLKIHKTWNIQTAQRAYLIHEFWFFIP